MSQRIQSGDCWAEVGKPIFGKVPVFVGNGADYFCVHLSQTAIAQLRHNLEVASYQAAADSAEELCGND